MITLVRVKNFRSLADVDVTLEPLTVLVGRNGAGKSSFVDVLRFTRDAVRRGLDFALMERQGIAALRRWMPRRSPDLEVCVQAATVNRWGEYSFAIKSKVDGQYAVKRESCRLGISRQMIDSEFRIKNGTLETLPIDEFTNVAGGRTVNEEALFMSSIYRFWPRLDWMLSPLVHSGYYSIFPDSLREPQKPSANEILDDNGGNLNSVLRRIIKSHRDLPDIVSSLDRTIGGVSDVHVQEVGGYLVTRLRHQFASNKSCWFDLAQESDGTLRMLALLVALYQDTSRGLISRSLIAIEEPELMLHPGALGVLSDVLQEASKRSQILITTQSPDLISRFAANHLRIVESIDGVTHIGPLEETQREVINEQLFSAGDLLRIEGLHGAPVAVGGKNHA